MKLSDRMRGDMKILAYIYADEVAQLEANLVSMEDVGTWFSEADRLREATIALGARLEEAMWLLNNDSGDIGGVGRKKWLERRAALVGETSQGK